MEVQPIFDTEGVDMQNYYFFDNGFSEEEIQKILQLVDKLPSREGLTANNGQADRSIRSSNIKGLPKNDGFGWLYFKLLSYCKLATLRYGHQHQL